MVTPPPPNHRPSAWISRFAPLVAKTAPILDVACGSGRHLRLFVRLGHRVVGVDRDPRGIADLTGHPQVEIVAADLEDGGPWPLSGRQFAGIVVTNYLFRPLFPALLSGLAPGGWLLYETYARGNERFGRPAEPSFLLTSGELLGLAHGRLQIVAFEQGEVASPKAAVVQRIAAVNDLSPVAALGGDPEPHPLPAALPQSEN